jgi:transcription elongation factor
LWLRGVKATGAQSRPARGNSGARTPAWPLSDFAPATLDG